MLTFSSKFRILSEVSNSSCTKSQAAEFAFIMLPPLLGGAFCLLVSEYGALLGGASREPFREESQACMI